MNQVYEIDDRGQKSYLHSLLCISCLREKQSIFINKIKDLIEYIIYIL